MIFFVHKIFCNISEKCKNIAKNTFFATSFQVRYFLQGSCRIVINCKNLAGNLWVTKILEDVSYLQESCKINARNLHDVPCSQEPRKISKKHSSLASYLFFAKFLKFGRISQDFYYLQEPSRISSIFQEQCYVSSICTNHERQLLFANFLHDISYSQRSQKRPIICCKNLAKHVLIDRISQDNFYLQETWKISIIRKNLARYLLFAEILQVIYCLQESCKISFVWWNLVRHLLLAGISQDCYQLHESFKNSLFCQNLARYLLFARILQDIYFHAGIARETFYSEESCNVSIICANPARFPFSAKIWQDIF